MNRRRPTSQRRADLLVLGGGTAGILAAKTAAGFGARVVMVEREVQPGGDCLWTGCVPSKTLRAVAAEVAAARRAGRYGLTVAGDVDPGAVATAIRTAIETIAPDDSIETMRAAGVEVVTGSGRFTGPGTLEVDGRVISFVQAVLATGSTPAVPDLPGLADSGYLTSETVWDLDAVPARFLVLGGGSTGCELAQAYARLGSAVTLVEHGPRLLAREDEQAGAIVADALRADGVEVVLDATPVRCGAGTVLVADGRTLPYDRLLVATGRRARTSDLGLETLGVAARDNGDVVVDDLLQTTNPRVWAAGDVTGHPRYTHLAGVHGANVALNAVLGLRRSAADALCPRVTYTDPEVAAVGVTDPSEVEQAGWRSMTYDHHDLDRAVTEQSTTGFTRVVLDGRGRVRGVVVVGPRAGETVAEAAVAIAGKLGVADLTSATHPYPGWNDGLWNVATAAYQRSLGRPPYSLALGLLRTVRRAVLSRPPG